MVLAGMSPLFVNITVSLIPIGLFIMAFLLFRRSTRARRLFMTPKRRHLLYIGLAVIYLLIGLSNLFTGRNLLYVALLAGMSILCLAIAVRQKVQIP
jgi:heme A synthase